MSFHKVISLVYRLAWDLDSIVVEADSNIGRVGDSSGSVGNSVSRGLGNGGGWDGIGHGDGVGNSVDNWGLGGVDNWGVDSCVVDSWESMVNIWGGQTSGVDQGGVSLSLSLSLGDGGGGSWDNRVHNWDCVVHGVGQREGVVDKWGVDSGVVDNWGMSNSLDNWGMSDSLDNWSVDSSVVDNWSVGNSLDSSLDNWNIVDAGDGELGVDEAAQQGRASNIAGHWGVDSGGGVEKSWVSFGLGLGISRSLSVVSIWVSVGSVSTIVSSISIWPGISIISVVSISISLWFSISGSLSIESISSVWVSITIGSVSTIGIWVSGISTITISSIKESCVGIGFRLSVGQGGKSENYKHLHVVRLSLKDCDDPGSELSFYTNPISHPPSYFWAGGRREAEKLPSWS